jgi:hypothetical protein
MDSVTDPFATGTVDESDTGTIDPFLEPFKSLIMGPLERSKYVHDSNGERLIIESESLDSCYSAIDPFDTGTVDPFDIGTVGLFDTGTVDPFDSGTFDPFDLYPKKFYYEPIPLS